MELATLDIDLAEAERWLDGYAQLVADERTAEDQAIAAGYRAVRRGLPVISLRQTMAAGGLDDDGLPRLALARADQERCFVRWERWRWGRSTRPELVYTDRDSWSANRGALVGRWSARVAWEGPEPPARGRSSGSTMVPVIPPHLRPRLRRLHGHHILWEVERWEWTPPEDPALLRHIRGDLFAVVATWDLTELERAVLSQRLRDG